MHAFVHTFADVPEGSNQLKQAVISYDIHGRAQTTVIDLQSGYATLIGDLIQVTLAKIQWSACKDDFFLKHGHLQLVSCKSLTEQGIDSRTILTLRSKALRSPLEGGGPKGRKPKTVKGKQTLPTETAICQDFLHGTCERDPCRYRHPVGDGKIVASSSPQQPPVASQPIVATSAVPSVSSAPFVVSDPAVLPMVSRPVFSGPSEENSGSSAQILAAAGGHGTNYFAVDLTRPTDQSRYQPREEKGKPKGKPTPRYQHFSLGDDERNSDSDDEPAFARVDTTLRRGQTIQESQAEFNSATNQPSLRPTPPASHANNLNQVTTQSSNVVTMQTDLSGYVTRADFEALQHMLHLLAAQLRGSNSASALPSGRTLSPQSHEALTSKTSTSRSASSQDRVPPDCLHTFSPRGSPSRSPRRAWSEGNAASVNAETSGSTPDQCGLKSECDETSRGENSNHFALGVRGGKINRTTAQEQFVLELERDDAIRITASGDASGKFFNIRNLRASCAHSGPKESGRDEEADRTLTLPQLPEQGNMRSRKDVWILARHRVTTPRGEPGGSGTQGSGAAGATAGHGVPG
jgi:hypothetical protein